jgi:hypothetical protein
VPWVGSASPTTGDGASFRRILSAVFFELKEQCRLRWRGITQNGMPPLLRDAHHRGDVVDDALGCENVIDEQTKSPFVRPVTAFAMPAGRTPQDDRTHFDAERVRGVGAAHMAASRTHGAPHPPHRTDWRFEKMWNTAPCFERRSRVAGGERRLIRQGRRQPSHLSQRRDKTLPQKELRFSSGTRAGGPDVANWHSRNCASRA